MKVELIVEKAAGAYLIGGFSGARPLFPAMTRDWTIQKERGYGRFLPFFNLGKENRAEN